MAMHQKCSQHGRMKLLTSIQVTVFNLELKLIFIWNILPCCKEDLAL